MAYSIKQKKFHIHKMKTEGIGCPTYAKETGIAESTLYKWMDQYWDKENDCLLEESTSTNTNTETKKENPLDALRDKPSEKPLVQEILDNQPENSDLVGPKEEDETPAEKAVEPKQVEETEETRKLNPVWILGGLLGVSVLFIIVSNTKGGAKNGGENKQPDGESGGEPESTKPRFRSISDL